jgi:hypothetical protein
MAIRLRPTDIGITFLHIVDDLPGTLQFLQRPGNFLTAVRLQFAAAKDITGSHRPTRFDQLPHATSTAHLAVGLGPLRAIGIVATVMLLWRRPVRWACAFVAHGIHSSTMRAVPECGDSPDVELWDRCPNVQMSKWRCFRAGFVLIWTFTSLFGHNKRVRNVQMSCCTFNDLDVIWTFGHRLEHFALTPPHPSGNPSHAGALASCSGHVWY